MMRFVSNCRPDYVEVTLRRAGLLAFGRAIAPTDWHKAPAPAALGVNHLLPLIAEAQARWEDDRLLVDNRAAARLPATVASLLGLPDFAPLLVEVTFHGAISDPECHIGISWRETTYKPVTPSRKGIELNWGERKGRVAAALYELLEAIDRFNAVPQGDFDGKVNCWSAVTKALSAIAPEQVSADAYTKSLTIFQAGTFALDIAQTNNAINFTPVLMSRTVARSLEDDAPVLDDGEEHAELASNGLVDADTASLLAADDRAAFKRAFDNADAGVRRAYPLRSNTYLLLDPQLQRALDVVRAMRASSEQRKREFVKNPRTIIATELGLDPGDPSVAALFVETKQYSDRVTGLGVWQRPELSWLSNASVNWLPEKFPVLLGGKAIEVEAADAAKLRDDVQKADASGATHVPFVGTDIDLYTARSVLEQIGAVIGAAAPMSSASSETSDLGVPNDTEPGKEKEELSPPAAPSTLVVVQIQTNFEQVNYQVFRRPRPLVISPDPPAHAMGSTSFKPHQTEGFAWLVRAWAAGWPGVLLADDMGLGKSYQSLAFLAWLKSNRDAAKEKGVVGVSKGPILVVAPTALLENWIEEADKHLAPHALGANRADVFGTSVKKFRNPDLAARECGEILDWQKIADHDWVLTTYETLADNHKSFALLKFSAVLFDEMQKIKDPGTLNTWAAKTLNADFVVGLTGTPVENRIEDLWTIMDRVFPGYLRDLKSFSSTYKNGDIDLYRNLTDQLLKPVTDAPAVVLRRMKDDVLEGLPKKTVKPYPTVMPGPQADSYAAVVASALSVQNAARARGEMLEIIQKLRGISLYPSGGDDTPNFSTEAGCLAWIEKSARLSQTINILRDLEKRGEKGLIFVEQRVMQSLLAEALTRLFGLQRPLIINGDTPGHLRRKVVDEFQGRKVLFDVMILSPKAAGVGLTITAANHVIHLSRWWNPAVEDQCNDRVYRIGQTKPVTIHVPIARHPHYGDGSFDVTLDSLLERKRRMAKNLLAPPVSDADVADLFESISRVT